ncbi:hypothetical protein E2C01_098941 [Portunus trituberculatus]|uniref:Uncharacterized protein n=1 Tax=Portunus trituberculatus TaxID=210409 RepID=A0A5B7KE49_PORTR|nr:hypothetical protein [Portunus trituberculatus]
MGKEQCKQCQINLSGQERDDPWKPREEQRVQPNAEKTKMQEQTKEWRQQLEAQRESDERTVGLGLERRN